MLDDLAVGIEPEDVDPGPGVIAGPILPAMQDHEIVFGNHTQEFHVLARVLARRLFEVGDEGLLAVADPWIVLDVMGPDLALNGLARARLIEHQAGRNGAFISF